MVIAELSGQGKRRDKQDRGNMNVYQMRALRHGLIIGCSIYLLCLYSLQTDPKKKPKPGRTRKSAKNLLRYLDKSDVLYTVGPWALIVGGFKAFFGIHEDRKEVDKVLGVLREILALDKDDEELRFEDAAGISTIERLLDLLHLRDGGASSPSAALIYSGSSSSSGRSKPRKVDKMAKRIRKGAEYIFRETGSRIIQDILSEAFDLNDDDEERGR